MCAGNIEWDECTRSLLKPERALKKIGRVFQLKWGFLLFLTEKVVSKDKERKTEGGKGLNENKEKGGLRMERRGGAVQRERERILFV